MDDRPDLWEHDLALARVDVRPCRNPTTTRRTATASPWSGRSRSRSYHRRQHPMNERSAPRQQHRADQGEHGPEQRAARGHRIARRGPIASPPRAAPAASGRSTGPEDRRACWQADGFDLVAKWLRRRPGRLRRQERSQSVVPARLTSGAPRPWLTGRTSRSSAASAAAQLAQCMVQPRLDGPGRDVYTAGDTLLRRGRRSSAGRPRSAGPARDA